jgi:hypothetical protein
VGAIEVSAQVRVLEGQFLSEGVELGCEPEPFLKPELFGVESAASSHFRANGLLFGR